jgi:multisubunit Na+/H+ antiporter MnhB subunit
VIEAACAGFLLAVLWMDLIFDSQVLSHRRAAEVPESVLASIAAYYHRATTTSRPMSLLIASVMVILLGALAFRWIDDPGWALALPSVLAAAPILLAAVHTVPSAKRLGRRVDGPERQTRLARAICRDHLLCLAFMSLFLAVWVAA